MLEIVLVFPFVLLLLSIAFFPLISHHLWEKNLVKAIVATIFGLPVFIYLIATDYHKLIHTAEEYFSFISLVVSLFTISGGILIDIRRKPSPYLNTAILMVGGIISNLIGTTGASMLLIRPYLRINRWRKNTFHLPVFFIFIVSNIGGGLTPIGDPPLYMGFLKGVPFFWTLTNIIDEWATEVGIVLLIFFAWDYITLKAEKQPMVGDLVENTERNTVISISGKQNFIYIIGVVLSVLLLKFPLREMVMWICAILSLITTPQHIREKNEFNFYPAKEVAILFAGIFVTMVPVLELVRANADKFGIEKPWELFFITGFLSSFLDNAPTYLTFFALAQGLTEKLYLSPSIAGVFRDYLEAVSCGAVFFGANTYIGNAPNFMVKSISEQMKVKAPNFIAYLLWSFLILLPSFTLIAYIFFGFPK